MLFLVMMTLGSWLIRYFGMAAQGKLAFSIVFELLLYQVPLLLEFILPLSFFIGLMLTFGRQYVEHEVTIIKSAGVSPAGFAKMLWPLLLAMFLAQAVISLYAKPAGLFAAEKLKAEQAIKSTFDLVKPKEFVSVNRYSLYVGGFSADKRALQDIILIEKGGAAQGRDRIILASRAEQVSQDPSQALDNAQAADDKQKNSNSQQSSSKASEKIITQLDLFRGRQYELAANQQTYNQVSFERYRLSMTLPNKNNHKNLKLDAQSSLSLLKRLPDKDAVAELGYRLSLPLVILLALVLALPLAQVRPRQGRWVRLLPAILLFATSVLMLTSLKGSIIKDKVPVLAYPALLALYAAFGVYLYHKNGIHHKIKHRWILKTTQHSQSTGGK